jgi:hypothetical protein
MPESVTDRPTKSHSYVFLLSKSARYFFDQEAVREPHTPGYEYKGRSGVAAEGYEGEVDGGLGRPRRKFVQHREYHPSGRNVRSVWQIATEAYPDAHFATYPQELVRRCILAGSSDRGCCPECGAPWEREVETTPLSTPQYRENVGYSVSGGGDRDTITRFGDGVTTKTTGWRPTCAHGLEPFPCTVLDPFAGSGTTGLVARKHGRCSILIELSADYCGLVAKRTQQLSLEAEPA